MTNYRWVICAMIFIATTVNYLDRQVLSLTWDEFIKPEFHWNDTIYGNITSVFAIVFRNRFHEIPARLRRQNGGGLIYPGLRVSG